MSAALAVDEPQTGREAVRAGWRRWRWLLAVALVIGLTALIVAVTSSVSPDRDRLGPDNARPEGGRALVRLLAGQGVDVRVARRSGEAVEATSARSTLVVTDAALLGIDQLNRLAADDATDLVLVQPGEFALSVLAPDLRTAGRADPQVLEPACSLPAARAAGATRAGGYLYARLSTPPGDAAEASVCYPQPGRPDEGSYLTAEAGGRTVTVIGQSDLLTNEHLDSDGNAALALWTAGRQPVAVWYTPDPLEPMGAGPQQTLTDLLPDWVFWVLAQLAVAAVVTMLWRARRLGKLVPEPLPVVVRAAETQEGRARLYRQASARGRAAATLRTTTLRRLAGRLATPAGTTPEHLVTLLAETAGKDENALRAVLLGPAPDSDGALVRLADDLDALERELSRDRPVRTN